MGQRNLLCTSEMLDLEMDQPGQHHPHPEPCVFLGRISDFPHPNIHPVLSASGNSSNFGLQHLPDHHDSRIFYGTQYNGLQHDHPMENHNFSSVAASNFYNPYMTPSGSRIFPIPLNHGSFDQLPSSSNHMITGVGLGEYERNNHFMDGVSGLCKRKNAEGFPGNYQHAEGSTSSSSSSSAPLNMELHHWEEQFESEAGVLDIAAFAPPENRVNSVLSITEGGPRRTVRIRPGPFGLQLDSVRAHNHQHLIQGNYMGQSFQPARSALGEQHFRNNGGDGGTSTWNYAPALPYLNGRSVSGGSLEIMNMTGLRHQETRSNGNSTLLLYPSVSQHHSQQHHHRHHHHLPPHMQGVQSHDYNYHPPVTTTSSWHPTSNTLHRSSLNPSQVDVGTVPRYQRHILPNGFRIYRPHQRAVPLEAPEYGNIPRLRILSEDGVAILDFADIGNFIDHHSDMRMDIDHMSYEELLALEERIGNVNTGLIEENIVRHLKTRTHVPLATYFNFNKPLGMDQEAETCIICQDEYKSLEKIGTLDCGHEYHADCIKKWLLVKNVCPICKTSALAVESKD